MREDFEALYELIHSLLQQIATTPDPTLKALSAANFVAFVLPNIPLLITEKPLWYLCEYKFGSLIS